MKQLEWESNWKPAIEKEIMGLIMMGLWDEVPEHEVPKDAKIFPGHFVFKIKCQKGVYSKAKARYVFGGHRTSAGVDFFEIAAYMAQMKTVRTVLSMAVADGHRRILISDKHSLLVTPYNLYICIYLIYVKWVSITQNAVKEKVQVTLPERKRCYTGNVMPAEPG